MNLNDWAITWGIPADAVHDLRRRMGAVDADVAPATAWVGSEAAVSAQVRLEASSKGLRLWRNNVGAATLADGSFLRWGLANDSQRVNEQIKSADLIGVRPVLIEQRHVGSTIGQFVSRECKPTTWHYTGTPREQAQLKWAELIISMGGDAAFCTGRGTL